MLITINFKTLNLFSHFRIKLELINNKNTHLKLKSSLYHDFPCPILILISFLRADILVIPDMLMDILRDLTMCYIINLTSSKTRIIKTNSRERVEEDIWQVWWQSPEGVHRKMLSTLQTTYCRMLPRLLNHKLENVWKEAHMLILRHIHGGTEENKKNTIGRLPCRLLNPELTERTRIGIQLATNFGRMVEIKREEL